MEWLQKKYLEEKEEKEKIKKERDELRKLLAKTACQNSLKSKNNSEINVDQNYIIPEYHKKIAEEIQSIEINVDQNYIRPPSKIDEEYQLPLGTENEDWTDL